MKELISHCGLKCSECGAYIATKNDDDKKRKEVARLWAENFKTDIKPGDINCFGCTSTGKTVFSYCNVCEIRKCGVEKGVINCAYCEEYTCEKLENFFKIAPDNRKLLDSIKSQK